MKQISDRQYEHIEHGRVQHEYGKHYEGKQGGVEIIHSPFTASKLAAFSHPITSGQRACGMLAHLYQPLIDAASHLFPTQVRVIKTRMHEYESERSFITSPVLKSGTHFSVAALVRAGVIPMETVANMLSRIPDATVYKDYVTAERQANAAGEIVGAEVSSTKVSTPRDLKPSLHKILVLPDPMGATGSTSKEAKKRYSEHFKGQGGISYFNQVIALHLIITPEYILEMSREFPELKILALRCDRGLSDPGILETKLGTYSAREKGLTSRGYIVPGAGDIGELLNVLEGPKL